MSESVSTWGELCERAQRDPGDTPADAPVERLIAASGSVHGGECGSGEAMGGGGCCSGACPCGH